MTPAPPVPPAVVRDHRGWDRELVQQSEAAVEIWRLSHPARGTRYLKIAPAGAYPSIADEAARTRWAVGYLPVPQVLDSGSEAGSCWMLTSALPGLDATRKELGLDTRDLVVALANGLRSFHEAPAERCPFDFRLEAAFCHVRARAAQGLIVPGRDFHPEHEHLGTVANAIAELERLRPASEDLVICHGDYCFPNILIRGREATGFIDLGELGVADRWWDLATATWSLEWNVGPGWDGLFLETYGIRPDPPRQAFFRLLYDLVS